MVFNAPDQSQRQHIIDCGELRKRTLTATGGSVYGIYQEKDIYRFKKGSYIKLFSTFFRSCVFRGRGAISRADTFHG